MAKKPKRTIYRVMWSRQGGWYVSPIESPKAFPLWHKFRAIEQAISYAKENQPAQVLIYSKGRTTGKYRITREFSYGCDSPSKG